MKFSNTLIALLSCLPVLGLVALAKWAIWCRETFGYTDTAAIICAGGLFAAVIAVCFISDLIKGDEEEDEGGW